MTLSPRLRLAIRAAIGSAWVFHGLYSKLLHGVPRHEMIVSRVFGPGIAPVATLVIGASEILLGFWVWSGWKPRCCAIAQTLALVTMNTLEILFARDLLISAPGMVVLNLLLLTGAWLLAGGKGGRTPEE